MSRATRAKKPSVRAIVLLVTENNKTVFYDINGVVDVMSVEQFEGKELKRTSSLNLKGTVTKHLTKEETIEAIKGLS